MVKIVKFKVLSLTAIFIDACVDIATSELSKVPVRLFIIHEKQIVDNAPYADRRELMLAFNRLVPFFRIEYVVVGELCTLLGGYVAGRIAKKHKILNGGTNFKSAFSQSMQGREHNFFVGRHSLRFQSLLVARD